MEKEWKQIKTLIIFLINLKKILKQLRVNEYIFKE